MDNKLDRVESAECFWKSQPWSTGVMEYWSVEDDTNHSSITPTLQHPRIKFLEFQT